MSKEIFDVVVISIATLFLILLLYRIKRGLAKVMWNKILEDFPNIKDKLDAFQLKISYLSSKVELLENKIKELEKKLK